MIIKQKKPTQQKSNFEDKKNLIPILNDLNRQSKNVYDATNGFDNNRNVTTPNLVYRTRIYSFPFGLKHIETDKTSGEVIWISLNGESQTKPEKIEVVGYGYKDTAPADFYIRNGYLSADAKYNNVNLPIWHIANVSSYQWSKLPESIADAFNYTTDNIALMLKDKTHYTNSLFETAFVLNDNKKAHLRITKNKISPIELSYGVNGALNSKGQLLLLLRKVISEGYLASTLKNPNSLIEFLSSARNTLGLLKIEVKDIIEKAKNSSLETMQDLVKFISANFSENVTYSKQAIISQNIGFLYRLKEDVIANKQNVYDALWLETAISELINPSESVIQLVQGISNKEITSENILKEIESALSINFKDKNHLKKNTSENTYDTYEIKVPHSKSQEMVRELLNFYGRSVYDKWVNDFLKELNALAVDVIELKALSEKALIKTTDETSKKRIAELTDSIQNWKPTAIKNALDYLKLTADDLKTQIYNGFIDNKLFFVYLINQTQNFLKANYPNFKYTDDENKDIVGYAFWNLFNNDVLPVDLDVILEHRYYEMAGNSGYTTKFNYLNIFDASSVFNPKKDSFVGYVYGKDGKIETQEYQGKMYQKVVRGSYQNWVYWNMTNEDEATYSRYKKQFTDAKNNKEAQIQILRDAVSYSYSHNKFAFENVELDELKNHIAPSINDLEDFIKANVEKIYLPDADGNWVMKNKEHTNDVAQLNNGDITNNTEISNQSEEEIVATKTELDNQESEVEPADIEYPSWMQEV